MIVLMLQAARLAENGIPLPANWLRISYFHCSLFGYFLGLLTATISSEVSLALIEMSTILEIVRNLNRILNLIKEITRHRQM